MDAQQSPLPGASIERAYAALQGQQPKDTVVVAVIDGGVDIRHEDLQSVLWTNDDERPGNNIDDDDNGYADDVHGWNFIGGPDGENVDHDSYELTRILANLEERFAGRDSTEIPAEEQTDYAHYLDLKSTFEQQKQDLQNQLAQIRQIQQVTEGATRYVQNYLGTDSTLTEEQVRAIDSEEQRVQQAQGVLLRLYDLGITPEQLAEARQQFEDQLQYGYDLDFNPRPIVGDDYADTSERIYGNADVAGPDPDHGTIVAGIVAADRTNDLGTKGIAVSTRIMAVRAVPDGDERDKDVANAIRYAVDNGADIINMSFGKSYSPQKEVVDAAVRYADERGVLLIHAAGNDSADLDAKPNYPSRIYQDSTGTAGLWLEVGASSWRGDGQLAASFSNYGARSVDLFAPGEAIYSTAPNQQYERADGTSMAAPVVTGVAALLMAYFPDLTAAQVRQILLESATTFPGKEVAQPGSTAAPGGPGTPVPFGRLSVTGGIVNAYAAVQRAEAMSSN